MDGLDIAKIPLAKLRSKITVIPQDPTLFTGTLRFNLDPQKKYSDQQITELFARADLQHVLRSGLDQTVAANGTNLSSGERQIICICRAILRQSKVIILDEATAKVDVITEKKMQDLISSKLRESTILTIAHRLNTIVNSDKIIVLDDGRIVAYDTPENLANSDIEFARVI